MRSLIAALVMLTAVAAEAATCPNCNGLGVEPSDHAPVMCQNCGGDGEVGGLLDAAANLSQLPAGQQPAPMDAVTTGLWLLRLTPQDTLADIGCGYDCRWGITAARVYGCKVIAIEIDPAAAESARRYVEHAGLSHLVTVVTGDATQVNFRANKGVAYLFADALAALRPKIAQFDAFVSFAHEVPGLAMQEHGDLYVYQRPQLVRVAVPRATANWGGREYSGRVCGNPRCSMCAAIQAQLATPQYQYVWQQPQTQQPAAEQPRGHWVTQKICHGRGRPCEYRRVWVED